MSLGANSCHGAAIGPGNPFHSGETGQKPSPPRFWFVWNENGRAPSFKHMTQALATSEAERLARLNPGHTFVVLESVSLRKVDGMVRENYAPAPSAIGRSDGSADAMRFFADSVNIGRR